MFSAQGAPSAPQGSTQYLSCVHHLKVCDAVVCLPRFEGLGKSGCWQWYELRVDVPAGCTCLSARSLVLLETTCCAVGVAQHQGGKRTLIVG